jgi:hypothetical protein
MRREDAAEIMASHGSTPSESLTRGYESSDYITVAYMGDEPLCVFGLVRRDLISGRGTPWMLASESVMKYKRQLLIRAPDVVKEMLVLCPILSNHVHKDNKMSVRWLAWMGFTIDEPEPIGVNGEMFHLFHKEGVA